MTSQLNPLIYSPPIVQVGHKLKQRMEKKMRRARNVDQRQIV